MAKDKQVGLEMRQALGQDFSVDDALSWLKSQHYNAIDAMKVLKTNFDLTLGEAKKKLSSHEKWSEDTQAAQELHEQMKPWLEEDKL